MLLDEYAHSSNRIQFPLSLGYNLFLILLYGDIVKAVPYTA
jgi:hypothetical protein